MRKFYNNNEYAKDSLPYIITNNNFYIRSLTNKRCKRAECSYISLCCYAGLLECLENIEKSNINKYILCVGYTKDFQVAITGTCKKEEQADIAVKREIFEEIDMESDKFELFAKHQFKRNSKVINSYVYKVKASDCIQSTKNRYTNTEINKDDCTNKITIVLYGTLDEISRIMCLSRLDQVNNEKIGFYIAIKISEAISICKQISILRQKYHWKTIFPYISL